MPKTMLLAASISSCMLPVVSNANAKVTPPSNAINSLYLVCPIFLLISFNIVFVDVTSRLKRLLSVSMEKMEMLYASL